MAHDASPSWSGFNYQGKVAIYYALSIINDKLNANINFDFTPYELTLENTEDFEIVISKKTVSLHQVKALQEPSFSSYQNALFGISIELYKEKNAKGYIHTWKKINPNPTKTLIESIADDIANVVTGYRYAADKTKTIIGNALSNSKNPKKKTAILRLAFPNTPANKIEKALFDICTYKDNALSRLSNFIYPDGLEYCGLEEINEKIKTELSKAFLKKSITNSTKQITNAFNYFLGTIDRHITKRHLTKKQDEILSIPFSKLLETIEYDFEDISTQYLAFQFKNQFLEKFDEFMSYPELYKQPLLDEGLDCNLCSIRSLLSLLPPETLWEYYKGFCPHQRFDSSNNLTTALNVNMDGVLFVLIKIFHEIDYSKTIHNSSRSRLIYKTPLRPRDQYLPTTINNDYFPAKIARGILDNPCMIETLFEVSTLIYDGKLIEKLPSQTITHVTAPVAVGADTRERREEILSNLRLIPTSQAKDELNA
ncbi:hypothetical protein QF019_006232 [Pseudomonas frederiksbergensis]|uniref:ABC-three component system protein n=1 Tax=Pseudomonas frederiksbergensis TaxID=104087 RepID=UPI003D22F02F